MKLDIKKIDLALSEKNIKALAFALVIKDMYVSSSVKNYNPYSLQKKLESRGFKFHHSTIVRYVNLLIKYKLAYFKDGCLIIKRLYEDKNAKINVQKGKARSFKDYVHYIRGGVIKRKIWQARYVYNRRRLSQKILENPKSVKAYKQAKRFVNKYGSLGADETQFQYKQTILSFCEDFNCSINEFYSTLKFLIKKNFLKVTRHIELFCKYVGSGIEGKKWFVHNGWIYIVECNTYDYVKPSNNPFKNKDSKKRKCKN